MKSTRHPYLYYLNLELRNKRRKLNRLHSTLRCNIEILKCVNSFLNIRLPNTAEIYKYLLQITNTVHITLHINIACINKQKVSMAKLLTNHG